MKSLAAIFIGFAIGCGIFFYKDRIYLDGMFIDNVLLETLTYDQKNLLKNSNVFRSYAIYNDGSEAYVVDGNYPKFVSIHIGLWSKDFTTIQGSSHTMREMDAAMITTDSGMLFHTINGKLYAYSSGEIRDNPHKFKKLISTLVEQTKSLVEIMKSESISEN